MKKFEKFALTIWSSILASSSKQHNAQGQNTLNAKTYLIIIHRKEKRGTNPCKYTQIFYTINK